jgi:hypothetical protein
VTPEEHDRAVRRLHTAFDLFEAGWDMQRQKLRRQHPEASDREINHLLVLWLRERPGAEHGDACGTPGTWPRTRRDPGT